MIPRDPSTQPNCRGGRHRAQNADRSHIPHDRSPSSGFGRFFRWRWRVIARRARMMIDRSGAPHADAEEWADLSDYPRQQQQLWRTHIRAWTMYQTKPYGGRVTLFRSTVHQLYCSFDSGFGWGELAHGGVEVNMISAGHDTIMEEPRVRRLGEALRAALQKTQAAA